MDYIEMMLGIKVQTQSWKREEELPYYILGRYEIRQVMMDSVKALFLYPKSELDQLASVKKQIARIQSIEALPVVIVLSKISRSRRQYLIAARIPFVVPEKQLYLPFLGVALQERFEAEVPNPGQLQPSAQLLLFYYLYQNKDRIYMRDAVKVLGFSAMTITRAVRQLEQTGYFTVEKDGVQKIMVGNDIRQALFNQLLPFMSSPVRKKIYVEKAEEFTGLSMAGLSALSQISRINPTEIPCYAAYGKTAAWIGTDTLMDASAQIEIELWKYDPLILGRDGVVDAFSLFMSLKDDPDERVEEALDELLEQIWEE